MDIREATMAYREGAVALWHAAGLVADHNPPSSDFDRAIDTPQSAALLREIDGALAASCMVDDDAHRGRVYYVSSDPGHPREDLGRQVMDAEAKWLKDRGAGGRKAMLMVRPTNTKVLGFYEGIEREAQERPIFVKWLHPKFPNSQDT